MCGGCRFDLGFCCCAESITDAVPDHGPEAVPGECTDRTRGPHTARACSSHELAARLVWAAVLDTRWELGRAPTKRDGVLRALHRRLAALAVPTHGSPAISHRRRRAEAHDARSQSARSVVAGDLGRGASRFVGVRSTRSATVRAGARALSRHPHGLVPYAALPQERSLESVARCRRARAWLRMCVPYVHRITLSSDTQPQLAPCRARAAQHEPRRTSTARCRRVRANGVLQPSGAVTAVAHSSRSF